ncbi:MULTISPECIES: phosphoribosylamine--glycine ligase [unclassified Agrococcus]|uniref:phosphoribosylamine--glycine ligase n=1 Tax=unclassified Agrococcus TaxID=2615065 RepID=UPI001FF15426|nr:MULTISPECIES: phosphoribosylamine--glycine ligase [unclassified Agrococcus]MDR7235356.1 phosphoribosylamine--glycine ligase [Agrococcus sp. BE272]UOW01450.1 phosphoribosylamine--glycine ligase [Agrococcus sp. SCSIO52902]
MRILVLGSGAREHAIIAALLEEGGHEITAAPGNAGIGVEVEAVRVDIKDPQLVTDLAVDGGFDLVVIGPEAPLVAGVADALKQAGVPVFGPTKAAAAIEGSKSFAKAVMARAGVPTGADTTAVTLDDVRAALDASAPPWVLKADGLAAGKGVIVTDDRAAAEAHAEAFLPDGPLLIEEYLAGPEVSLFVLTDGEHAVPLAPAQDFKRLGDGDTGPNTGGMGAYSPLPWLAERFGSEQAFVDEVVETVALPTIRAMAEAGTPFTGLLYCGLIVTDDGVKVIEFNARFGDPETQVVLPRIESGLADALLAAANGSLGSAAPLVWRDSAAVAVVLASEGYPGDPITGRLITGVEDAEQLEGVRVLHAATGRGEQGLTATGGRVLNVVGTGATLAEARERAYAGLGRISLEGGQSRSDIAARA